jgi:glycosidase
VTDAFLLETKFFGDVGLLYPYDVRYDEHDRAFCNPLPDGQAQFRVQAEPELAEATLVYNDGSVQGAPLEPILAPPDDNRRFVYWQTTIRPAARRLRYSFAFKNHRGQPVYFCRHGIDHAVEPLDRWQLDLDAAAPFETPEWMRGAPVYQIFPDRFANGDPSNDPPDCAPWGTPPRWFEFQGGDLQGIARRLDYLQELGVEVLYLNPIFTSPSTHKYDTADYYQVDPAFGGNEALRTLVDELHRRDMRILLDASFNHCHPRFFAFQDLVKNGPASPYADWFTIYEYPVVLRYRPEQLTGYWKKLIDVASEHLGLPVLALDKADTDGPDVSLAERPAFAPTYEAWYNVPNMPKLNLSHPATRQYFLDVTAYWLREFHIDGWRMDVARHIAPDFWQDFRRVAKATRPDCYLLSEIWGDTSPWLQGDMFDATMNYFLRDLSLGYFAQQTTSTPEFVDGLLRMLALYAPQVQAVTHNLLSSHDTERFLTMAGGDLARLKLATLLQFTLPGAPGLYYGDEIGMEGGSDPDCRRAFPWHQPKSWRRDVLEMVKTLIHLRKTHLALRHGDFYLVWQGEDAFAFLRRYEGQRVLIVVNRGAALERLALPVESSAPQVVWGAGRVMFEKEERVILESAAESATIISV